MVGQQVPCNPRPVGEIFTQFPIYIKERIYKVNPSVPMPEYKYSYNHQRGLAVFSSVSLNFLDSSTNLEMIYI